MICFFMKQKIENRDAPMDYKLVKLQDSFFRVSICWIDHNSYLVKKDGHLLLMNIHTFVQQSAGKSEQKRFWPSSDTLTNHKILHWPVHRSTCAMLGWNLDLNFSHTSFPADFCMKVFHKLKVLSFRNISF